VSTALFYDDRFLKHDEGPMHPENPERLRAILRGVKEHGLWDQLLHEPVAAATEENVMLVHTKQHFDFIKECSRRGSVQLDPDTHISSDSFEVALLAVGAAVAAVRGIMNQEFQTAFAAVRPPGHHATSDQAMGFCLFNNIAVAARYLTKNYGLQRVLIMDWDVHHGNGTQEIFDDDPSVIYISLHKRHHYPGTGYEYETGSGKASGTKINIPLNSYDPLVYEKHFKNALSQAEKFQPEFILISCGFDAHENDPLGTLGLTNDTYARLTQYLIDFAGQFGHHRIFSILEGGYDRSALAEAGAAHIEKLMEAGK
jgi:acetoin utilization deacetylase AcuC-like enzyme